MEGKEVVVGGVGPRAGTANGACANVPGLNHVTEALVVGKERWEEIRNMRASGQSV